MFENKAEARMYLCYLCDREANPKASCIYNGRAMWAKRHGFVTVLPTPEQFRYKIVLTDRGRDLVAETKWRSINRFISLATLLSTENNPDTSGGNQ